VLQIVFIVVVAIYIFRTARRYDRNPYLWTAGAVVAFFGVQILLAFLIGGVLIIGAIALGWSENILDENAYVFGIVCAIPAYAVVWFISKRVSVVKDELVQLQPPPPNFP